jgi:hypothetical protein
MSELRIPLNFIRSLSEDEWMYIMGRGGRLNAHLCARLWRCLDRQDEPPESITLMVSKADIERAFPELGKIPDNWPGEPKT